ncbi:MAG: hypothetical protein K8T25_04980 [Planctomycetia bacterium]|nr:hypothetical protein [Planctomycetia bacterium]
MTEPIPECDRAAYNAMVLNVIAFFAPICSDYQIWRGVGGKALDLKYSTKGLYIAINSMEADGLLTKARREGYPQYVYSLTPAGAEWLRAHSHLLSDS